MISTAVKSKLSGENQIWKAPLPLHIPFADPELGWGSGSPGDSPGCLGLPGEVPGPPGCCLPSRAAPGRASAALGVTGSRAGQQGCVPPPAGTACPSSPPLSPCPTLAGGGTGPKLSWLGRDSARGVSCRMGIPCPQQAASSCGCLGGSSAPCKSWAW